MIRSPSASPGKIVIWSESAEGMRGAWLKVSPCGNAHSTLKVQTRIGTRQWVSTNNQQEVNKTIRQPDNTKKSSDVSILMIYYPVLPHHSFLLLANAKWFCCSSIPNRKKETKEWLNHWRKTIFYNHLAINPEIWIQYDFGRMNYVKWVKVTLLALNRSAALQARNQYNCDCNICHSSNIIRGVNIRGILNKIHPWKSK